MDILEACINKDTEFFIELSKSKIDFEILRYPILYGLYDVVAFFLELNPQLESKMKPRDLEKVKKILTLLKTGKCVSKQSVNSLNLSLEKLIKKGLFEPLPNKVTDDSVFLEFGISRHYDHIKNINYDAYNNLIKPFQEKIVAFSDTHGQYRQLVLPQADILICCGDVTTRGRLDMFVDFMDWFSKQNSRIKIYVPGNNDECFWYSEKANIIPKNITCLNGSGIVVNFYGKDIKIYGTSMVVYRKFSKNNSFSVHRRDSKLVTNLIPKDTDILVTHGPPFGIGDLNSTLLASVESGDYSLRSRMLDMNVKYHFFGHQHQGKGVYVSDEIKTVFVNTACDFFLV